MSKGLVMCLPVCLLSVCQRPVTRKEATQQQQGHGLSSPASLTAQPFTFSNVPYAQLPFHLSFSSFADCRRVLRLVMDMPYTPIARSHQIIVCICPPPPAHRIPCCDMQPDSTLCCRR